MRVEIGVQSSMATFITGFHGAIKVKHPFDTPGIITIAMGPNLCQIGPTRGPWTTMLALIIVDEIGQN